MPMIWDEQAQAMVWEDDLMGAPVPSTPMTEQGQFEQAMRRELAAPSAGHGIPPERASLTQALGNITKQSALPTIGSMIGSRYGKAGEAVGGMAGQAANWLTGLSPMPQSLGGAAGELALQALPGPAARAASEASTVGPWLQRQIKTIDPALGAGLAREAYTKPIQGVMKMRPANRTVAQAFEDLRANPEYSAMGAPITKTVTETPPGSLFSDPVTKTITETPYPIQFPAASAIATEQAAKFGEQKRFSPGLADSYLTRITQLSREGGTFENAHQLLRDLAQDIRNPGTATGEEIRTLKKYRSAVWQDIDSHALTPELQAANQLAARQMGADELLDAVQKSRTITGEIRTVPNVGTVIKKMEDVYLDPDNPFIRSAISPGEFRSLTDDLSNLNMEQLQTKSNEGSLAVYGAAMGAGGGAGAAVADLVGAPKGVGGLIGSGAALMALRASKEQQKKAAFRKAPAARKAALKSFRSTPGPAFTPEQAALPAHMGAQSIAEMFLRQRGINPLLQPEEEFAQ